jgi:hypothetical protein
MFKFACVVLSVAALAHTALASGSHAIPGVCVKVSDVVFDTFHQGFTVTLPDPAFAWVVDVTPGNAGDQLDLYVTVNKDFPHDVVGQYDFASENPTPGASERVIIPPNTGTDVKAVVYSHNAVTHGVFLPFTIIICNDVDDDGVTDDKDLCLDSTRGSREHVDVNGCERDQVDFDMDGWCNPDMPRIGKKPFSTRDDFCTGVDNCKLVKNAGQEQNYADADGAGDACTTGQRHAQAARGPAVLCAVGGNSLLCLSLYVYLTVPLLSLSLSL